MRFISILCTRLHNFDNTRRNASNVPEIILQVDRFEESVIYASRNQTDALWVTGQEHKGQCNCYHLGPRSVACDAIDSVVDFPKLETRCKGFIGLWLSAATPTTHPPPLSATYDTLARSSIYTYV